jgi:pimeloyl-ACP methyl ester carboxylesterase
MVSKSLSVQGVAMRWEEEGEGFPIVLVHGIPTSPALWRHVVPRLHGRSMAWEMVGYGQSIRQGEGRDLSVVRQADYLLAWLDGVGVEQAVFVGHDLGGGVLQIAASHARERFAGLVLTNSIAYDSWPIPSVKAMRAMGGLVSRAPDALLRAITPCCSGEATTIEAVWPSPGTCTWSRTSATAGRRRSSARCDLSTCTTRWRCRTS